jgi:hypothetical protein
VPWTGKAGGRPKWLELRNGLLGSKRARQSVTPPILHPPANRIDTEGSSHNSTNDRQRFRHGPHARRQPYAVLGCTKKEIVQTDSRVFSRIDGSPPLLLSSLPVTVDTLTNNNDYAAESKAQLVVKVSIGQIAGRSIFSTNNNKMG